MCVLDMQVGLMYVMCTCIVYVSCIYGLWCMCTVCICDVLMCGVQVCAMHVPWMYAIYAVVLLYV